MNIFNSFLEYLNYDKKMTQYQILKYNLLYFSSFTKLQNIIYVDDLIPNLVLSLLSKSNMFINLKQIIVSDTTIKN